MIGGIITRKYGASIGGLIISAVNITHWQLSFKKQPADNKNKSEK
jgi:hypothetical protein